MKRFLLILGLLVFAGLIWFLFIKEYDYQFHFKTKYGPGVAFNEVSKWNEVDSKLANYELLRTEEYQSITKKVIFAKN